MSEDLIKLSKPDLEQLEPSKVGEWAVQLTGIVEMTYTELMRVLHFIDRKKYYQKFGYDTMGGWVQKVLGFSKRKAQQFIFIWETLIEKAGRDPEELDGKEWTKLRALAQAVKANAVSDDKIEEELVNADEMKRDEYVDHLKGVTKRSRDQGKADPAPTVVQVHLNPDQKESWDKVVSMVRKKSGKIDDNSLPMGAVIENLCLSYLCGGESMSADESLGFYIRMLERAFPDRILVAVHKDLAAPVREAIEKIREGMDEIPPELKKR